MKIATVMLESLSPYSSSQRVSERKSKESWDNYEERVWRERAHVNADGMVFIPPMAFKRSLETAARYLRMRIQGKDRSEYGKHFRSGVLVMDGLVLPIRKEDLEGEWLHLSSKGKAGHMDVRKCEPIVRTWKGHVTYYVADDIITEEVFERHLEEAGAYIGIGRFRPENGGFYGRYKVETIEWSHDA